MLGFGMCSIGISRLNCKSTTEANVANESVWLFSDLGICLKSQQENLAFQVMTIFKYATIRSSLAVYSPLIWLTMSSESHQTSSFETPRVVAIMRPAMTASYSALLLVAQNPRVYDCSMMDPTG